MDQESERGFSGRFWLNPSRDLAISMPTTAAGVTRPEDPSLNSLTGCGSLQFLITRGLSTGQLAPLTKRSKREEHGCTLLFMTSLCSHTLISSLFHLLPVTKSCARATRRSDTHARRHPAGPWWRLACLFGLGSLQAKCFALSRPLLVRAQSSDLSVTTAMSSIYLLSSMGSLGWKSS